MLSNLSFFFWHYGKKGVTFPSFNYWVQWWRFWSCFKTCRIVVSVLEISKLISYSAVWYERVGDKHADFTFPLSSLLPLRDDVFGKFTQFPVKIPQDSSTFLAWEYGPCVTMGPHIWPWELLLYTPLSREWLGVLTILRCTYRQASYQSAVASNPHGIHGRSKSSSFERALPIFTALYLFDNGLASLLVLLLNLSAGMKIRLVTLAIMMVCLFDLSSVLLQLRCHIYGQYIDPMRPKTWTLCLFGYCKDFTWTGHVKLGFLQKAVRACLQLCNQIQHLWDAEQRFLCRNGKWYYAWIEASNRSDASIYCKFVLYP